ncbi:MAG: transposase [Bacteroidaceae bacterium]|nr:transposase [Bacteroidaceae bacterium]MBR4778356.1 transposase [Bacteroidaceae bacterium]
MRKYQTIPKEKKAEIISTYLTGDNSYEELGRYYGVTPGLIRNWVSRYRKKKNAVSLQAEPRPLEDMARKKKEEKSPEVLSLEARIRELELQNLALNTLIDVAERNGIEIRKKSGAKQ